VRTPFADRRYARATATDLRRELRHADARLYQQQIARAASMMSAPPVRARRTQTAPAVAACLGAGLFLIAAGEFMHGLHWMERANAPVTAAPARAIPATQAAASVPVRIVPVVQQTVPDEPDTSTPRPILAARRPAEATRVAARAAAPRSESVRTSSKRPMRSSGEVVHRVRAQRQSPGVMDRLRLGWLRTAFRGTKLN
jgi:hypothetical protein